ncbi:hypothetical protein AA313_de0210111 [Arthrobotrys entomopaga]|nr:hypothetical protein AA313_de0210111 [Arthrobotrys entomopaga]
MCNKHTANLCSSCRSSWYCSRDCQQSDWPYHKLLCKAFANQPPRPSPMHKRGILFPADKKKPEMVWRHCRLETDCDGDLSETPDTRPYLGADKMAISDCLYIEVNQIRNRVLGTGLGQYAAPKDGFYIFLQFRDAFLEDGSPINKSILASLGAMGSSPHRWCGPVLAIRENANGSYADITLTDFRHILDYFVTYGLKNPRDIPADLANLRIDSIRGVKLCCDGT